MADSSKHKTGTLSGSGSPDRPLLEMQQSLIAKLKNQQYTEALSLADQILNLNQHSPVLQDLRRTLADKVELDRTAFDEEETGRDKESSDSASEDDDSDDSTSTSESDSEASFADAVCDRLHVSLDEPALLAPQRKQISNALKEQLEGLKLQEASQKMEVLGL